MEAEEFLAARPDPRLSGKAQLNRMATVSFAWILFLFASVLPGHFSRPGDLAAFGLYISWRIPSLPSEIDHLEFRMTFPHADRLFPCAVNWCLQRAE